MANNRIGNTQVLNDNDTSQKDEIPSVNPIENESQSIDIHSVKQYTNHSESGKRSKVVHPRLGCSNHAKDANQVNNTGETNSLLCNKPHTNIGKENLDKTPAEKQLFLNSKKNIKKQSCCLKAFAFFYFVKKNVLTLAIIGLFVWCIYLSLMEKRIDKNESLLDRIQPAKGDETINVEIDFDHLPYSIDGFVTLRNMSSTFLAVVDNGKKMKVIKNGHFTVSGYFNFLNRNDDSDLDVTIHVKTSSQWRGQTFAEKIPPFGRTCVWFIDRLNLYREAELFVEVTGIKFIYKSQFANKITIEASASKT